MKDSQQNPAIALEHFRRAWQRAQVQAGKWADRPLAVRLPYAPAPVPTPDPGSAAYRGTPSLGTAQL